MVNTIIKHGAILFLLCSVLASPAEALPYTKYDLNGNNNSISFTGFAIFENESVFNNTYDGDYAYLISQTFLIPKFLITFSTGYVYSGSGYLILMDLCYKRFSQPGYACGANDMWELGHFSQYSPTGGYGSVSKDLDHNNGLPITTLPDYFFFLGSDLYASVGSDFSFDGEFHFDNPVAVAVVPEPTTSILLGIGIAGLVTYRRKINKY